MKKFKLQKYNTLTSTIKKSDYNPKKVSDVAKKVTLAAGVLSICNVFTNIDLNSLIITINLFVIPLSSYAIYETIKKSKSYDYEYKLSDLKLNLMDKYIFEPNISNLNIDDIYSKDGIDLIRLNENAAIIQVIDNDGKAYYNYYKDKEYTDITEVVNSCILSKKQKRKYKKPTVNYNPEDYNYVDD